MHIKDALAGATCLVPPGVILMAAKTIEEMEAELADLIAEAEAIYARVDDGEDVSDDDLAKVEANRAAAETLKRRIAARRSIEAMQPERPAGRGRQTTPEIDNRGGRGVPAQPRSDNPRGGFRNFGEFAMAVRAGSMQGNQPDQRLLNAATTYGNEGTGADGGFAVPPEFRREIWQKVMDQENLLSRCAQLVTGSNNITIPKDETTPWQTSGGIQVYWEAEAAAATASKPALEMSTMRLNKLMALVPMPDELLDDAPGLESWLRNKAPAKMAAKLNTAIIRGTGVGQPLGILNAPCLISVGAETSQPAATVYFANINKMWSRMYAPCRRNAVWLINQDIEPQLDAMAFDPDATSKVPVYLPPGGLSDSPYARLKGRPVVPIEACSTLGTQGDIILADLQEYWALTKGQDVKSDVSLHLYFDQGMTAFRFTFRVNGQPSWGAAISPENGSNTRSCFVALDTRS